MLDLTFMMWCLWAFCPLAISVLIRENDVVTVLEQRDTELILRP